MKVAKKKIQFSELIGDFHIMLAQMDITDVLNVNMTALSLSSSAPAKLAKLTTLISKTSSSKDSDDKYLACGLRHSTTDCFVINSDKRSIN